LQKNLAAFEKRNVSIYAISVDNPPETLAWVKKRGLTMPMLSDPKQKIIEKQFRLRNPEREELAIHAVYILDEAGKVFYRKIGKRRPMPPEFLAAIDWRFRKKAP